MSSTLSHSIAGRHAIMAPSTVCGSRKMAAEALQQVMAVTPLEQPVACNTSHATCLLHIGDPDSAVAGQAAQSSPQGDQAKQPFTHRGTLTTCHAPARTPPPATPVPSAAAATQDLCSSGLPSVCGPCPAQKLHRIARCAAAELHLYITQLAGRVCLVSGPEENRCARRRRLLSCSSRPHRSA